MASRVIQLAYGDTVHTSIFRITRSGRILTAPLTVPLYGEDRLALYQRFVTIVYPTPTLLHG